MITLVLSLIWWPIKIAIWTFSAIVALFSWAIGFAIGFVYHAFCGAIFALVVGLILTEFLGVSSQVAGWIGWFLVGMAGIGGGLMVGGAAAVGAAMPILAMSRSTWDNDDHSRAEQTRRDIVLEQDLALARKMGMH